ncbi:hypothetical protein IQ266_04385 [filamentous cyanobacterium LEGE 11480]|uniref:Uncharacterized protein n=1 Tax=Romeriopsis navalis LEGE 11480 TaxID=2777977 RepID=A0A928Z1Z3_9CYAN|nr:hypothetical protein [Romeriopsis navalis]MBE9028999.1 hypothetical protein [Romeriopsis navalis LEGE 11480]
MIRSVALALPLSLLVVIPQAQAAKITPQQQHQYRQAGTAGLDRFLAQYGNQLKPGQLPTPAMRSALDAICQQRDCHASKLYWYTDLDQAKAAAKKHGKPILSLRLLGNLDEELSCANSRFFRLALYANQAVSTQMREQFILHWSSERPVPKVTIDFGNGRKLERTVTGNSIHYVLDAQGRPIEAIPGLYGPQAFANQLTQAKQFYQKFQTVPAAQQSQALRQYHYDRYAKVQQQWATALAAAGIKTPPKLMDLPNQPPTASAPSAAMAAPIAMTKMVVESPLVRIMTPATANRGRLERVTDESTWRKLARRYRNASKLDANSLMLMRSKLAKQNSSRLRLTARQFERSMALDTVRNEYQLHSQLHQWFSEQQNMASFEQLNQRVYSQLFLTPANDPWLGLSPTGAFAAIEGDGIVR